MGFMANGWTDAQERQVRFGQDDICDNRQRHRSQSGMHARYFGCVFRWLRGEKLENLTDLVDRNSRLMPNALRAIGFGHTMGGIMKNICASHIAWPEILEKLRALCRFWRNDSYKEHVARILESRGVDCRTMPQRCWPTTTMYSSTFICMSVVSML